MRICKKCGAEIEEDVAFCPKCGQAQSEEGPGASEPSAAAKYAAPAPVDNGGFLWGLLGFCIPIVGLILFLVWKDTKPRTGKAAGVGALVSVIVCVVFYVLMAVAGIGVAMAGF